MKKTLSKSHRQEIARALVIEASKKAGNAISKELAKIQDATKGCLLAYFYEKVPEIPVNRVAELLQQRVFTRMSLTNTRVYPTPDNCESFANLSWVVQERTNANIETNAYVWGALVKSLNSHGKVFDDSSLGRSQPSLYMVSSFPDVADIALPSLRPDVAKGDDRKLVNQLTSMHGRALVQLSALKDLLEQAREMYDNLLLAMQQFKNSEQLAKGIPEAVKHFPAELTTPPATKEVADPKFLNDIRAKLAKGLPV